MIIILLFCTLFQKSKIKMQIISTVKELEKSLSAIKKEEKAIGLVPTMGALHAGHASLVKRSVEENDVTVVSVSLPPLSVQR